MFCLIIFHQTLDQANRVVIVEHRGPGRLLIEQGNQVGNAAAPRQDADQPSS